MQLNIHNDALTRMISKFGNSAMEARQVSRRIGSLLPSRLGELKREHCRGNPAMKAERLALADKRYEDFINQSADVSFEATQARIQYETHAMLYRARQSLRAFAR